MAHKVALASALFALAISCVPMEADASSLAVGDLRRPINDSVAVLSEFFGKPTVEVHLFAQSLSEQQRQSVAAGGTHFRSRIGISPIGTLMIFFVEGAKQCSGNVLSYTMVFQKTAAFPIPVTIDSPINWAYSSSDLSDYGLNRVECSLTHGSRLRLSVAYQHMLDKAYEARILRKRVLPKNISRLPFRWEASIDTELFDSQHAFRNSADGRSILQIDSTQVVDSDAIYLREYSAISIRMYGSQVPRNGRVGRASANADAQLASVYAIIGADGGATLTHCTIAINKTREDGGRHGHSARCDEPSHLFKLSGRVGLGETVKLEMKGSAESDVGLQRPPMGWDISIKSTIEGVFDK